MAARNTNIAVPARTWTRLTDGPVTVVTLQNKGGYAAALQGSAGVVDPAIVGPTFLPGQGPLPSQNVAELFPAIAGVNEVYAWSEMPTVFWVCHA